MIQCAKFTIFPFKMSFKVKLWEDFDQLKFVSYDLVKLIELRILGFNV